MLGLAKPEQENERSGPGEETNRQQERQDSLQHRILGGRQPREPLGLHHRHEPMDEGSLREPDAGGQEHARISNLSGTLSQPWRPAKASVKAAIQLE